ncbi:arsenate reductase (glutaredoxin) [Reinekea marinisedimentorum]|uniref:Arsenate reductase n=1 Tax=Reinekea marinisedimentorum TaxID=230495 RepID=A0A4R3I8Q1_9GAMM|nr:arsenate reductase (glutaredoxin) [Reinekea marinisedimentorum]TCS42643.1 arsenate reductase [Reinekea marinisedimentorum]
MKATIYHNPRCSKSRQALALLADKQIETEVHEYLKSPLNSSELTELIKLLGVNAHDLLRTKEAEYKEAGLSKDSSESEIIAALCNTPKLMERPIVVTEKGARIGRPTEAIEEIL